MKNNRDIQRLVDQEYQHGFVTEVEADTVAPGLNEDVIRFISAKKNEPEFLLKWRLKAYQSWLNMVEPRWASVHHDVIDYQSISYYSAPKSRSDTLNSLDDIDP
jgi:Fe-S cluster assembly protein SufB